MRSSYEDALQRGGYHLPYQELLMLVNTNHLHQHDCFVLEPLVTFFKLGQWPELNVGEVYLLNTQCLLKFLHKIGFHHSTYDINHVQE